MDKFESSIKTTGQIDIIDGNTLWKITIILE